MRTPIPAALKPATLALAILVAAAAAPALAAGPPDMPRSGNADVTCTQAGDILRCTSSWGRSGGGIARIVDIAPRHEEITERFRRWVERCRPVIREDRYGVGRYLYAAAGCEFGRVTD